MRNMAVLTPAKSPLRAQSIAGKPKGSRARAADVHGSDLLRRRVNQRDCIRDDHRCAFAP
jgi:hypothetical protein